MWSALTATATRERSTRSRSPPSKTPTGLQAESDNVYAATTASGAASLQTSGSGSAGTIEGGELEESTVDTSTEFSKMIAAQQAYSAAAQVMSTVNSMFQTLMEDVR